jgi:transposase
LIRSPARTTCWRRWRPGRATSSTPAIRCQADLDGAGNAGGDHNIDNTATADSNETDEVSDSAEVPLVYDPDVSIDKTAAIADDHADQAGDIINYTVAGNQHRQRDICGRVLSLGVLRTGAPWRDLPERYGPYTTAYNRFNRWRKAGIWDRLMDAVVKANDGKVQMIDSSIVRVDQHASGVKKRVEIVVWAEAEEASPRKSTRGSMRKAARSAS